MIENVNDIWKTYIFQADAAFRSIHEVLVFLKPPISVTVRVVLVTQLFDHLLLKTYK